MRPGLYVPEYGLLEVAALDAYVIEEDVITVLREVLGGGESPRDIAAAVADEHRFLDVFHSESVP